MRVLFIIENEYSMQYMSGMKKKVLLQKKTFEKNGITCDIFVMDKGKTQFSNIAKVIKRIPLTNVSPRWKYYDCFMNYDVIYFRRPFYISMYLLMLLDKIKHNNPSIRIIMEIPTYPYDGEYSYKDFPLKMKDIICRNLLKRTVDALAVVGSNDRIPNVLLGIKTIVFSNGIDSEQIVAKSKKLTGSNTVGLIAVASMCPWHGFERLLRGLRDYYRKSIPNYYVHLFLVGNGTEINKYQTLAQEAIIRPYVHFLGFLEGEALDEAFRQYGDVGVCSLGRYKSKMYNSTDLKSREYLARGIPIITGAPLGFIDETSGFCLEFPNDESNICIERIVRFYQKIYQNKDYHKVSQSICDFARLTCDFDMTFSPVIEYIRDGNEE